MLTLAFVFLWWRSYRLHDTVITQWPMHGMGARSQSGVLTITLKVTDVARPLPRTGWWINNANAWDFGGPGSNAFPPEDPLGEDELWLPLPGYPQDRWAWLTFKRAFADDWWHTRSLPAGPRPTGTDSYFRVCFPH